jgi:hypothetical protein
MMDDDDAYSGGSQFFFSELFFRTAGGSQLAMHVVHRTHVRSVAYILILLAISLA